MKYQISKILTVELTGGLGNQLFQIVSGWHMAQLLNRQLSVSLALLNLGTTKIDFKFEDIHLDGVPISQLNMESKVTSITRRLLYKTSFKVSFLRNFERTAVGLIHVDQEEKAPIFHARKNLTVRGYAQNVVKVFETLQKVEVEVKPKIVDEEQLAILKRIQGNRTLIMHIRGGDYLTRNDKFGNLSLIYYENAVRMARGILGTQVPILVFTDDQNYAASLLEKASFDYEILNPFITGDTISTLWLMTNADAYIISNSTFAWWAACLSKTSQLVIAPSQWSLTKNGNMLLPHWLSSESEWI